jgi:hypothetical protein
MDLSTALLAERHAAYVRLKGGYSLPIAGAIYWAALAWAGTAFSAQAWTLIAMYASGLIFPLGILVSKLLRNDFMKDRTAVSSLLFPAFVGMLLFFPMLFAALSVAPSLAPLMLAIGMSMHWPVIGWTYGKTAIYTSHAIVRAIACFAIWMWLPEGRYTLLPAAVALVYVATVVAIFVDLRYLHGAKTGASAPARA